MYQRSKRTGQALPILVLSVVAGYSSISFAGGPLFDEGKIYQRCLANAQNNPSIAKLGKTPEGYCRSLAMKIRGGNGTLDKRRVKQLERQAKHRSWAIKKCMQHAQDPQRCAQFKKPITEQQLKARLDRIKQKAREFRMKQRHLHQDARVRR